MNGLPYYKAYPRDFMEGTIGMPFELKGAYRLILDLIYMQGGKLPDDARYIAGLLGCSTKAWNGYRAKLLEMGKVRVVDGYLRNYRADAELESLAKLSDVQREKRLGKRKNKGLEEPQINHTEPEPEPKREDGKPSSKRAKPRADLPAKSRMTPDWNLSEEDRAFARSYGFSDGEIDEMLTEFRVYWMDRRDRDASKSEQGWGMTWRNRVKAIAARLPPRAPNVVTLQPNHAPQGKRSWADKAMSILQREEANEQALAQGTDSHPAFGILPRH